MFFTVEPLQRVTPSHFPNLCSGPDLSFCWANFGPGPYVWHQWCNNRSKTCIQRVSEMLFLSLCKRWRYRKSTEKNRQTSNMRSWLPVTSQVGRRWFSSCLWSRRDSSVMTSKLRMNMITTPSSFFTGTTSTIHRMHWPAGAEQQMSLCHTETGYPGSLMACTGREVV